ncbi:MAG: hypothetical protein GY822_01400 [Deltaproteobacteria bacterium]|nr:hypothetical protein [Deltaproteobacteria bacterium]
MLNDKICDPFYVQSEQPDAKDKLGATDLRLICADGKMLEGSGYEGGNWGKKTNCPKGQFICGLQTQVQSFQGD